MPGADVPMRSRSAANDDSLAHCPASSQKYYGVSDAVYATSAIMSSMLSCSATGFMVSLLALFRPHFLNAANRDVGDETSARVPADKVFDVFGNLDDALADGLFLAAVHRGQE